MDSGDPSAFWGVGPPRREHGLVVLHRVISSGVGGHCLFDPIAKHRLFFGKMGLPAWVVDGQKKNKPQAASEGGQIWLARLFESLSGISRGDFLQEWGSSA